MFFDVDQFVQLDSVTGSKSDHIKHLPRLSVFYTPSTGAGNTLPIFTMLLCLILIISTVLQAGLCQDKKTFIGYSLFTLNPDTQEKLDYLQSIWNGTYEDLEVDFWQPPTTTEEEVLVLVEPTIRTGFINQLKSYSIPYNETFPNLHQAMKEELRPMADGRKRVFKDETTFHVSQYNSWNTIENYLKKTSETLRSSSQLQSIGKSHEGRDLLVIKLGNNKGTPKPAIWIDAGIHAREWIAPATILYIIDLLSNSAEGDNSTLKRYLDEIDWYFLPVMNPDGYSYTHSKDRMWRKNRSQDACSGGRRCCKGVDLNRNFGTAWGTAGASKNPCSNTYMGSAPFSEPEAKAVKDFVTTNANNVKGFFTFHSFGQLWMYPYGYKKRTYTEDLEEQRQLSVEAAKAIKSVHGTRFKTGTAADILYSASGASEDWAAAELKIKYSYCVELRPSGLGNGFILSPRHIVPSGEEIWAGLRVYADKIIEKYGSASGGNSNSNSSAPRSH